MRSLFLRGCIVAVLLLFCLPVHSQEYYTRIAGPGTGEALPPVIGPESVSSAEDIHVFPSGSDQSEVSIALNWCNPINFLIGANGVGAAGYSQGYYYSENSCASWSGSDQLPGTGYYTSDPSVVFDAYNIGNYNGYSNGFFNYLEYGGFSYSLKIAKTTNGGRTWFPAVSIPSPGDPDKNHITADATSSPYTNNLYVGYTDFAFFPGSPVRVSRSTDHGSSFSVPVDISQGITSLFSQGVNLAVGPGGEVYAVWAIYDDWNDLDPNVWDEEAIGFSRSFNGGASWESPSRILEIDGIRNRWTHKNPTGDIIRVNSFPVLAVDRSGGPYHGTLYLVWANKGGGADRSDIYLSRSTNAGTTWSTPLRVNDDQTSNDQWLPWITVSSYGRVTVVFYDSREDLTPPVNQATEAWIAESTDGGLTFINSRVSDVSFVPVPIPGTATGYMGDYIGIASKGGSSYPAWVDNRTGNYQVFIDIHNTYMDDLENIASWSRSSVRYATAYGSGPKLVYAGNRWHRLFHMNEHLAYSQSTDDGTTWTGASLINGTAVGWLSNPSLYSFGGKLHSVFRTDLSAIYYLRGTTTGVWDPPRNLKQVDGVINGIASAVDQNGICHVLYSYTKAGPAPKYILAYSNFDTGDEAPVLGPSTNLVMSPAPVERIAAVVDPQTSYLHAVWESGGEILYRFKVGNLWVPVVAVSGTPTPSSFPALGASGGAVHLVWQEEIGGNSEIYYRSSSSAGSWSEAVNLSNSEGSSVEPTITGQINGFPLVVWADNSGGQFDVLYSLAGSGLAGSLGSTGQESHYPVCAVRSVRNGMRAVVLCTDGSSSLYQIACGRRDFPNAVIQAAPEADQRSIETTDDMMSVSASPNPFNPTTVIRYHLPASGHVSLSVFDILGQEVRTLIDRFEAEGAHSIVFDAAGLPSGVYLYRLRQGPESKIGRMVLAR